MMTIKIIKPKKECNNLRLKVMKKKIRKMKKQGKEMPSQKQICDLKQVLIHYFCYFNKTIHHLFIIFL